MRQMRQAGSNVNGHWETRSAKPDVNRLSAALMHVSLIRLLVAFAMIAGLVAPGLTPTASAQYGYTSIRGTVVDSITSQHIVGATVTTGMQSTTTQSDGSYQMMVSAGTYQVTASKTYYTSQTKSVTVANGQTAQCDFSLAPTTGIIRGLVFDDQFAKITPPSGKSILVTNGTITVIAGQQGGYGNGLAPNEYLMDHVPAGTYDLTCSYPGYPSQRRVVTVTVGKEETVDFCLGRCVLYGTVKDMAGQPLANVRVGDATWFARSAPSGRFEILWPTQGNYDIVATLNGYRTQKKTVDLNPSNKQPVDFTLLPPLIVSNMNVTSGNGQITLTWTNPTAADFDHINVYRSSKAGQVGTKIGQTTGPSIATYIDTGLQNGKTYYYVLRPVDQAGIEGEGYFSRTWTSQADWAQWFLNGLDPNHCPGSLEIASSTNQAVGQGIAVKALVGASSTVLADSGILLTPTGSLQASLAAGDVTPILTAETLHSITTSGSGRVDSEGSLNKLVINVGGNSITADYVKGAASAVTNGMGAPTVSGSLQVTNLVVNGQATTPSGAANQVITLPFGGKLVLNEQITTLASDKADIIVNGLRLIASSVRNPVLFNKSLVDRLKLNGNNVNVSGGGHSNQDLEVRGNNVTVTGTVTYVGTTAITGSNPSITTQHTSTKSNPVLPRQLGDYKVDAVAASTFFTGDVQLSMATGTAIRVKGTGGYNVDVNVGNGSVIYVEGGDIQVNDQNFNRIVTLISIKSISTGKGGNVDTNGKGLKIKPADNKLLIHGDAKVHINGNNFDLTGIIDSGGELQLNGNGMSVVNGFLWGYGLHVNGNDLSIRGDLNLGTDTDIIVGRAHSGVKQVNGTNNEGTGTIFYAPQHGVIQIWSQAQLGSGICDNNQFTSIWIPNIDENTVTRLNIADGSRIVPPPPSTATSYSVGTAPSRTAIAFDGTLWVANREGNSISRIRLDGTVTTVPLDPNVYGSWCRALCIDQNGFVWVGTYYPVTIGGGMMMQGTVIPPQLIKIDPNLPANNYVLASYPILSGGGAYGMVVDRQNGIWITTHSPYQMTRFNSSTLQFAVAGKGTDPSTGKVWHQGGGPDYPYVANISDDGAIWVSGMNDSGRVYRFVPETDTYTYWSLPKGTTGGLRGVALDRDGTAWVADTLLDRVWRARGTDGLAYGVFPAGDEPTGIVRDVSGNMWVANKSSGSVFKYAPDGRVLGKFKVGEGSYAQPYNYTHMTGTSLLQSSHRTLLEYSSDGNNWTDDLSDIPPSEGVYIRFTLGRANPSTSPTVDDFTIQSLQQIAGTPLVAPAAAWAVIVAPNGFERWLTGVPNAIRWSTHDPTNVVSTVRLYYRTTEAGAYNLIATGEPNDGALSWTVPSTVTETARVKIELYNAAGQLISSDESDDMFAITAWGKISGRVTRTTDGASLESVLVTDGTRRATTGSDGSYLLDLVPAGPVTLQASRDGYVPKNVNTTVVANQTTTLNIALDVPGKVTGTVSDAQTGTVLGSALISEPSQTTQTSDSNGVYSFTYVPPGTYTFKSVRSGYQTLNQTVTVTTGQTVTLDFALARAGLGKISGLVKDANTSSNIPLAGATVTAGTVIGVTDASGFYTLNDVVAGSLTVTASKTGYNSSSQTVTVNAGNRARADFSLQVVTTPPNGTSGTVTGTIYDADGNVVLSGATITVNGAVATSGTDGRYTISSIPAGTYTVLAAKISTSSGTYGFIPASQSATVTNGGTATVNFTLTAYGRITGKAFERQFYSYSYGGPPGGGGGYSGYNDVPINGAVVSDGTRTAVTGTSDPYMGFQYPVPGQYTLWNVPPGTYTVTCTASGYISSKQTVTVTSKNATTADFMLSPAGDIGGTIKNSSNVAIAGVSVEAGSMRTTTDANGVYSLANVPVGTVTVLAYKAGYASQTKSATVVQAQVATVDFTLATATTGVIQGTVKRADTLKPLRNVTLSNNPLITYSRDDGTYSILDVPAGSRSVTASKAGFQSATQSTTVTAGQTSTLDFNLTVTDTTPPTITDLTPAPSPPAPASKKAKQTISATITDGPTGAGVDPDTVELVIDNVRVAHTFNVLTGKLTFTPTVNFADGAHTARIYAKDLADNAATTTWTFTMAADLNGPSVSISSPVSTSGADAQVQGIVSIVGSASDDNYPLTWYLKIKPVDDPNWSTLKTGTYSAAVSNAELAQLNTTVMVNGRYTVMVEVVDVGDNHSSATTDVLVIGTLKLGQYARTEAPDIAVPFANGVPFTLTRSYNSHDFHTAPFAEGWTHNYNLTLSEDTHYSNNQMHDGNCFYGFVIASLPDGNRLVFTPISYDGHQTNYQPPSESKETLARITEPDPDQPEDRFLLHYILTTKDGSQYTFFGKAELLVQGALHNGVLTSLADRFSNTVFVNNLGTSLEITDTTGRKITVNMDGMSGRATSAVYTSPTADVSRQVNYAYGTAAPEFSVTQVATAPVVDENGNLTSFNATTEYSYFVPAFVGQNTNLSKVVLPVQASGTKLPSIEVTYDSEGRMIKQRTYVSATQYSDITYTFTSNADGTTSTAATTTKSDSTQISAGNVVQLGNGTEKTAQMTPIGYAQPAVTSAAVYADTTSNPLFPTQAKESSDSRDRYQTLTYQTNGNPTQQKQYLSATVDANGNVTGGTAVVSTSAYDPNYNQLTQRTRYQGYNSTGSRVETLMVYGKADGSIGTGDQNKYLVQEKRLIDQTGNGTYAVTSFTYDSNPAATTKNLTAQSVGPTGVKTTYQYDQFGNATLTQVTDAANTHTTPTSRSLLDSFGNPSVSGSSNGAIRSLYDGQGRVYERRTYADSTALTRADFTAGTYDALTPLTTTRYGYDRDGRQKYGRTISHVGVDEVGIVTRSTFGPTGLLTRSERYSYKNGTETIQSSTDLAYDDLGRKTSEVRSDNTHSHRVNFIYDNLGRLTDEKTYSTDSSTLVVRHIHSEFFDSGLKKKETVYGGDGVNKLSEIAYTYDDLKRTTSATVDPSGANLVTQYGYNAEGGRVVVLDARGSYTFTRYDNANRTTDVSFPLNGISVDMTNPVWPTQAKVRVHYDYYATGQTQKETRYDTDGATILSWKQFAYDEVGRITSVTQPINGTTNAVTTIEYRDAGQTLWSFMGDSALYTEKVTDAEGKASYHAMDSAGRLIKIRHPDLMTEERDYFDNGNLKSQNVWTRTGTKQTMTFDYTDDGKLSKRTYPDGGYVQFQYDLLGRRTSVSDSRAAASRMGGSNSMTWTYDDLDRVASVTLHDGRVLSYTYTATGQRTEIKVQNGASTEYDVTYDYNSADRLYHVYEGGQTLATYGWDANGNLASRQYNQVGGATTNYTYNLANQLNQIKSTLGATTLAQFDYTVDGLGRRTQIVEQLKTTSGTLPSTTVTYAYDQLSRLTSENRPLSSPAVADTYTFDKVGNRLTKTGGNYTYSASSDKIATDPPANAYTFDLNGNQITKGGWTYEFDYDNQLKKATSPGSTEVIEFWYDPMGNRIKKTVTQGMTSTTVNYVVDGNQSYAQVLIETDSSGTIVAKYAYGDDLLKVSRSGDYYYFYDGVGSTRLITDTTGNVKNRYIYDAYGNQLAGEVQTTITNEYLFTGERIDADTGLAYLRARYYDPTTGRFTQIDSRIGTPYEPQTLHRYIYAAANPVLYSDPSGHDFSLTGLMVGIGARVALAARYLSVIWNIYQKISLAIDIFNTFQSLYALADKVSTQGFNSIDTDDMLMLLSVGARLLSSGLKNPNIAYLADGVDLLEEFKPKRYGVHWTSYQGGEDIMGSDRIRATSGNSGNLAFIELAEGDNELKRILERGGEGTGLHRSERQMAIIFDADNLPIRGFHGGANVAGDIDISKRFITYFRPANHNPYLGRILSFILRWRRRH